MYNKKYCSPLFIATISLASGIYIQSFKLFNPILLLLGIVFSCLILLIFAIKNIVSIYTKIFIYSTIFILGSFVLTVQTNKHAILNSKFDGQTLDVIAKVTSKKILTSNKWSDWKEIVELHVQKYKSTETQQYTQADFHLQCYSIKNIDAQVDDTIEFENIKIKIPKDQTLSQNTSYKSYLIKEGFLCSIFLYKIKNIKILHSPKFSIKRWVSNTRNKIYANLQKKMSAPTFTYFSLIFLGNSGHKDIDKLRDTFNYWGLAHYLARAGLHIILFILIWTIFLRLIPIPINFKKVILIIICLIYKFFSWSSIPFTRAFYAFILTEVGKILNFQTNFLHLLSIICMTILLFNPMQLFFLDFQLTFALTFALSYVSKFLH